MCLPACINGLLKTKRKKKDKSIYLFIQSVCIYIYRREKVERCTTACTDNINVLGEVDDISNTCAVVSRLHKPLSSCGMQQYLLTIVSSYQYIVLPGFLCGCGCTFVFH